MIVTEIKKIGKGQRYSVSVDERFEGVFEAEILAKHALKTGQEIDQEYLVALKIENGNFAAFDRALNLLEHGSKTQKQVRDYLTGKGYPEQCVQKAMQKLQDYGYLDDLAYANEYVRLYSSKDGEKKIKFALKSKGVDEQTIDLALQTLDEDVQIEACRHLARKKMRGKALDGEAKQKLFAYLAGRGFDFDIIKSAISQLEADDDWN